MRRLRCVLLTNDDGIDAPGLAVLAEAASELADEVWIVAPAHDQSGTSHSLSLHHPVRVATLGERRFAVGGTPGDCVVMGLRHLLGGTVPDLVLSGVNRGANLGVETVFSGTVGAAMTALLLGVPAIALSQAFNGRERVRWETARAHVAPVVERFAGGDWGRDAILNVNFPDRAPEDVGPIEITTQGAGLLAGADVVTAQDPRGLDYHWLTLRRGRSPDAPGTEATAIAAGRIALTPLRFERTDREVFERLVQAPAAP